MGSGGCNGICSGMTKWKRPLYAYGDRYCAQCEKAFRNYPDLLCPCCCNNLRIKRHGVNSSVKERIRNEGYTIGALMNPGFQR